MDSRLARARESVDSAAELADDSTIHEQLNSIRQGLNALVPDLPEDDTPEPEVPSNASPDPDAPKTATSNDATSDDSPADASSVGSDADTTSEATSGEDQAAAAPNDASTPETPETDVPADATPDEDSEMGARLRQIERQLAQLGDDAEGRTADHIATARDHIDAYRRSRARDWE